VHTPTARILSIETLLLRWEHSSTAQNEQNFTIISTTIVPSNGKMQQTPTIGLHGYAYPLKQLHGSIILLTGPTQINRSEVHYLRVYRNVCHMLQEFKSRCWFWSLISIFIPPRFVYAYSHILYAYRPVVGLVVSFFHPHLTTRLLSPAIKLEDSQLTVKRMTYRPSLKSSAGHFANLCSCRSLSSYYVTHAKSGHNDFSAEDYM